ncbi:transposase family protein [Lentibacillus sp. CBA3610]|uniref:transposase family protein n=1 Tax=Lentibacillus sp. CBA3610 TaxID=2518176 RepID=UPI001595020E|nr:transposase family protein [Lentibacillus sp. CBA3610]QKY70425.1 transposase family protein [Lentibacillus sp. CBA3610]
MVTRKIKRNMEKGENYFFELMKFRKHFFKDLQNIMKHVSDPRHQSYIDYGCDILLFMIILKNVCDLKSMRSMTNQFNKDECIVNIKKALNIETLEELPHYDTINDFLSRLEPDELRNIRTYMIRELLKKRCFEDGRIGGKYWAIIIDGTGLFTFNQKHCDHCLRREYKDEEGNVEKTVYMHHVLEAKLVVGNMVFSVDSEFIENESEEVPKQDCELNAFYRMASRLNQTFKRLPICIIADSLYACENVFKTCHNNHWKFLLRFKEDRIKSISEEFHALDKMEETNGKGQQDKIRWVNHIAYNDWDIHVLEGTIKTADGQKRFMFLTDIKITDKNCRKLLYAGRSRWKIENEGFNRQKHIRYHIEHASSHDYTAMKNHYLLTQITDILMQLFENGSNILKRVKKTAKEISSNLLETIRTKRLTDEDITKMVKPIQVRFT